MKLYKYIQYLERMDGLIRRRQTGNPKELADRLNISVRTVHRIIAEMKDNGLPVEYDIKEATYYYLRDVVITFFSTDIK